MFFSYLNMFAFFILLGTSLAMLLFLSILLKKNCVCMLFHSVPLKIVLIWVPMLVYKIIGFNLFCFDSMRIMPIGHYSVNYEFKLPSSCNFHSLWFSTFYHVLLFCWLNTLMGKIFDRLNMFLADCFVSLILLTIFLSVLNRVASNC